MKLSDMVVSAIIKKGILCEIKNLDVVFDIPTEHLYTTKENGDIFKKTTAHVKADNLTIRFDKDEK